MKKAISVSIKTPCAENWASFTPATDGRFCSNCQKTVADLTQLSDRELLEYLQSRTAPTCVRMRNDQLKSYAMPGPTTIKPGFGLFKAAMAGLLLLPFDRQGFSQAKDSHRIEVVETSTRNTGEATPIQDRSVTVSGTVVDELGEPLPGISIVLQGTTTGTSTDASGWFSFPEPLHQGQTLLFSFVGYETKEYKVKASSFTKDLMNIKVDVEMQMDISIMGELVTDQPYTVETNSLWTKIKRLF